MSRKTVIEIEPEIHRRLKVRAVMDDKPIKVVASALLDASLDETEKGNFQTPGRPVPHTSAADGKETV